MQTLQDFKDSGWFAKPVNIFAKPDWASASTSADQSAQLNAGGPVAPGDLVGADGRCAPAPPPPALAAAPTPPADRPVGSIAGDLAHAPMPAAPAFANQPPGAPQLLGGVALGMSECEVVRRAGLPGNVNISASDKGERRVVLTYLSGPWPGIYTFDAGRLKVVDRAPEQPAPLKEPPQTNKAKMPAKPKTASREIDRAYGR
jgi:hypothetical protein